MLVNWRVVLKECIYFPSLPPPLLPHLGGIRAPGELTSCHEVSNLIQLKTSRFFNQMSSWKKTKQISHHLRLHSLHFWTPKERLPQNFLSPFRGPKRMLAVNCSAGRLPQMGPQPPQLRRHSWVESMRDSRNTSAKRGKTDSSWWFQPNWWESSPSRDKI